MLASYSNVFQDEISIHAAFIRQQNTKKCVYDIEYFTEMDKYYITFLYHIGILIVWAEIVLSIQKASNNNNLAKNKPISQRS